MGERLKTQKSNLPKPATLLTEPLFDAMNKHNLSLGVTLTHLVPPVVLLSLMQIRVALLRLTTQHANTSTSFLPFLPSLLLPLLRKLHVPFLVFTTIYHTPLQPLHGRIAANGGVMTKELYKGGKVR